VLFPVLCVSRSFGTPLLNEKTREVVFEKIIKQCMILDDINTATM
jgi:hypothetical protein